MAWDPVTSTNLIAGGLMLLLAGWLLYLDFWSRAGRAFALFLVLRGGTILSTQARRLADAPDQVLVWDKMIGYFALAEVAALVAFLLVYAFPRRQRFVTVGQVGILGVVVVIEAAYLLEPCLAICTRASGLLSAGPLSIVWLGLPLALGIAALLLMVEQRALPEGPRRSGLFLVAATLLVTGLFETLLPIGFVLGNGLDAFLANFDDTAWPLAAYGLYALGLGPVIAALIWASRSPPVAAQHGRDLTRLWVATALAVLSAGLVEWGSLLPFYEPEFGILLIGAWRMVLPLGVTLALLRHCLFGLDAKVRRSAGHGVVTASIVIVFFVASESAEALLTDRLGTLMGLGAAGLVLLAIHPLERWGKRMAQRILPRSAPPEKLSRAERMDLFREQAAIAWSEGSIDPRHRLLIDKLRERLGIEVEVAERLEAEARATLRLSDQEGSQGDLAPA